MEPSAILHTEQFNHLTPSEALGKRQEAQEAAQKFESIFLKQMIVKMRENASVGEDGGMFGKGPGSDTYTQWFDDNMSSAMTQSGQVGVADVLFADFERLGAIPTEKQAGIAKEVERAGMHASPLMHKSAVNRSASPRRSTNVVA